jgi:hypothetical protein
MKSKIVPIKNIARVAEAADALMHRPHGMPGMGVVHGESGLGKTTTISYLVNQVNGVFVRAMANSSPSSLLGDILHELDVAPRGGCAQMTRAAVEALAASNRPLFIDEMNLVLDSRRAREMSETMRDIHDLSTVPVILVGDDTVLPRLQHREQLYNRMAQQVRLQRCDAEDARMLADRLCEVRIEDDLLEAIVKSPDIAGVTRRILVALAHCEARARAKGKDSINLAGFGRGGFFSGDAEPTSGKVTVIR